MTEATNYLSQDMPALSIDQILPIPAPVMLDAIDALIRQPNDAAYQSVTYNHLLHDQRPALLPLWVVTYWMEVVRLRKHAHQPWSAAEYWLQRQRNTYQSPEKRLLCDNASQVLLTLPWAGDLCGFMTAEPWTTLSTYLSNNWLSSAHADKLMSFKLN